MTKRRSLPLFRVVALDGPPSPPGAFTLEDAIVRLRIMARAWERANVGQQNSLGAVRGADGALHLCAPFLLRRDDGAALTDVDWDAVRAVLAPENEWKLHERVKRTERDERRERRARHGPSDELVDAFEDAVADAEVALAASWRACP